MDLQTSKLPIARFIFGLFASMLLWLVSFSFFGLSIYIHYFSDVQKPAWPLIVGGIGFGFFALLCTSSCMGMERRTNESDSKVNS